MAVMFKDRNMLPTRLGMVTGDLETQEEELKDREEVKTKEKRHQKGDEGIGKTIAGENLVAQKKVISKQNPRILKIANLWNVTLNPM